MAKYSIEFTDKIELPGMRQALRSLIVSLAVGLFIPGSVLADSTTEIARTKAASTDGTESASVFTLSVTAKTMPTALSTASNIELSLSIAPEERHSDAAVDVFTVLVANNQYYKLNESGDFSPWNGAVETLTPFAKDQTLADLNRYSILNGTLVEQGSYLFFAAYSLAGETRLFFTPDPAQLTIKDNEELPDDTGSLAAVTFEQELEGAVVQSKCIFCHVEGGSARNSSLQFQRNNTASALNNYSSLKAYIEENGVEKLLGKVSNTLSHGGGEPLEADSEGYAAVERFAAALTSNESKKVYSFAGTSEEPSARQASFLTEVSLEPHEATLRRAALLLQGRLPTTEEKNAIETDAELRKTLRSLMRGKAFREFVVTSVNDRLLTEGSENTLNTAYSHFLKLHNRKAEENLFDISPSVLWELENSLKRASGELVAHVVESGLPYSEILTADYMMMNRLMNTWLEGTASFNPNESNDVFKPSVVQGFYHHNALEEVEFHENSNSIYRAIGEPLANYPHAGLLTDFGFISRYPTTATNRNRARARWTFYHFLGIDIEKSSQRPTDEASLSDRNNPTMNNPNCTVCHALLDPVAGAFQNWDENNFYRGSSYEGRDALDGFYKHPPNGAKSLYRDGDLWYRDMRAPGLFDTEITERDATLRALAELIVEEPLFLNASAAFWWQSVFGKPLLDKPAVEADKGFAAKLAAYRAQQEAIDGFATALAARMDAKDMLVEMFMSPWFGGEAIASYAFDSAHYESRFGSEQLLTPEQLARKTRKLTGTAWRTFVPPSGNENSKYNELSVLLGGIDSEAVTQRAIELTPSMTSILMTHATESACIAVARQFAKPAAERALFKLVEETTLPLFIGSTFAALPSENKEDKKVVSLEAEVSPGPKTLKLAFVNPYCDFNGSECTEQRKLYVGSLTVTSPSGVKTHIQGNDPRLVTSRSAEGHANCYEQAGGLTLCFNGSLTYEFEAQETGRYVFESSMSAELAPRKGGLIEVFISLQSRGNPLTANTNNAELIRQQISALFYKLHGTRRAPDSDEVSTVFEIFAAGLHAAEEADNSKWQFSNCSAWQDGLFFQETVSQQELDSFRTVDIENDSYHDDWDILGPIFSRLLDDSLGTKYAWTAVMMYMLSHYDYLHE